MKLTREGKKIYMDGQKLPPLDIKIFEVLIKHGIMGNREIMYKLGKLNDTFIANRTGILVHFGLLIKPMYAKFDVNPEIKDELRILIEDAVREEENGR